jgi:hypothetical protein
MGGDDEVGVELHLDTGTQTLNQRVDPTGRLSSWVHAGDEQDR